MSDSALRIDKWLWHARFFKTRTLAAKIVSAGVRVNGARIDKPKTLVRAGDTLTFAKDRHIRVIKVLELGVRRGPAAEAQALYEDLDPPKPPDPADQPAHTPRPDKRERRAIMALKERDVG